MLIPVRCFSCGKVTGNKWRRFQYLVANAPKDVKGTKIDYALKKLKIHRYCCRQIFVCNYEFMNASSIMNR